MKSKYKGKLKMYEVRWYDNTTGVFLGETKIHADNYESRTALELDIAEQLGDRDLDVKIVEVYESGHTE